MSDKATAVLGKVTIGDEELTITRFRGHKAILAGALIKRVMSQTPELTRKVDAFRKEFRENNYFELTPGLARIKQYQEQFGVTPADFEGSGGESIKFPENPEPQQIITHIFPDLFDLAEEEITAFLALITIPDSELEAADDSDQIDEVLKNRGKALLRRGYVEEILELVVVGWEVLQDQIIKKNDRLGKLRDIPFLGTLLSTVAETEGDPKETTTPGTSPQESPTSSTDSPDSTDGVDEKSSTESPGTSSSSSSLSTKELSPTSS